jgi:hypothetical protein
MTHSKAYILVRSIVRFIVGMLIVTAVFVGAHLAAMSWITAIPASLALVGLFLVISHRQNTRRA